MAKRTHSEPGSTPRAIDGTRVLDLTDETGVYCTKWLAALGADVIIIEPPGGNPMRNIGPFYHDEPHPERSLHWFLYNQDKRSITLNLETEDGRQIFKRLVKGADFVVECFPPGYLDGLGLGYKDLSALNPGLVLTSITPFGQTGPYAHYKSCDLIAHAMGDFIYQCGKEDGPPVNPSLPLSHFQTGTQATIGSLLAYYYRERTGEGQHVDVSLRECGSYGEKPRGGASWKAERKLQVRGWDTPHLKGVKIPQRTFACKGGWVVASVTSAYHRGHVRQWLRDEGVIGELDDKKYDDWFNKPTAVQVPEIEDLIGKAFSKLTAKYTKEELYKEGQSVRNIQVAPIASPKDIWEDEQLRARGFFVEIDHPELGTKISYPGASYISAVTPWKLSRRAPFIGEHNDEIYIKELGISKEELIALKQAGAI